MNILILYATNSGGTEMVANEIMGRLSASGHTVNLKRVLEANAEDVTAHDVVLLGTPSWDFDGKEGQPHEDYFLFKKSLQSHPFEGKKVAIFGLGDSSYRVFNGGTDNLEAWVSEWKAQKIVDSLRIDKFFFTQSESMEAIEKWCTKLIEVLK